jgi:hypothetical protein
MFSRLVTTNLVSPETDPMKNGFYTFNFQLSLCTQLSLLHVHCAYHPPSGSSNSTHVPTPSSTHSPDLILVKISLEGFLTSHTITSQLFTTLPRFAIVSSRTLSSLPSGPWHSSYDLLRVVKHR